MSRPADPVNQERVLSSARAGDGIALRQLLPHYRSYSALLARLQIVGRLQGKVYPGGLGTAQVLGSASPLQSQTGVSTTDPPSVQER